MDSFFASIEIRDKPSLQNKPVAVAGKADERGVLTTCNYIARKFGLHSAMPTKRAIQLCKDVIILPVNIAKYSAKLRLLTLTGCRYHLDAFCTLTHLSHNQFAANQIVISEKA